ncbi:DEAD/DEAH box helicase [Yinghuangia seranimata]|uniref:DEAD/DEAH box helicase n=1 Tax=Yinghuangia seranimata TaxID=408067 RepID=UPI00248AAF27|nr:DEAD/DEAH box helicase [Yinghuangia seranimata]MDI2130871.1 DEAD/DEAH box helicase [Yinghuangia seranimata]
MTVPSSGDEVITVVREQSSRVLETYRIDPGLIVEHFNNERRITQGGYGDRQVYELVQNGADELRETPGGGDIHIVLTPTVLYCANEGSPVTPAGAETILRMSVSRKRGGQIGRFGVGVKSVLSVTDTPQFFSTSGSFGFDLDWSREQIRLVQPDVVDTPVLRMARPINREQEVATDPVLAELLSWATTVVRLPLKPGRADRLGKDLAQFPFEFQLFSPQVTTVILDDRRRPGHPVVRRLSHSVRGDFHSIQDELPSSDEITRHWRVFTATHEPGETARGAAGELHDRPRIDVSWAVPVNAKGAPSTGARGRFWAYFPTNYTTLLRGILNAPWKTSEDRQNLYKDNEFNEELVVAAARLVVTALPELVTPDDPADYLGLLPGRGRESPQFADEELTEAIWRLAAELPSLPDQNGVLRVPAELSLHPEGLQREWLNLWAGHPGRPVDWCHHSIEQRERRSRVELIRRRAEAEVASTRAWLEALVQDGTPAASVVAVRIAGAMKNTDHPLYEEASTARILLTEDHGFVAAGTGRVYRRASDDGLADDLVYVHPEVCADPDGLEALVELGVHLADAKGRLAAVVGQGFDGYGHEQWTALWDLTREVPARQVAEVLGRVPNATRTLQVRTVAGRFRSIDECLLPGRVVPADGSRDGAVAVDTEFHRTSLGFLEALGLRATPQPGHDPAEEFWFDDYRQWLLDRHLATLSPTAPRPRLASVHVTGARTAGPLRLMSELSEEGRAAFIAALPEDGLVENWTLQIGQSTARSGVPSPLVWMLRTRGLLRTTRGLTPVASAVGPALQEHGELLPVARLPEHLVRLLGLPERLSTVPQEVWAALLHEVATSTDEERIGATYALALRSKTPWPQGVQTRCRVGDTWGTRPDAEIAVASTRADFELLVREEVPALLAPSPEDADAMVQAWGMQHVADVVEEETRYVASAEPRLLVEEFPHLRVTHSKQIAGRRAVACAELERIVRTPAGMTATPVEVAVEDNDVLVLDPEDDLALLAAVDRALNLGLGVAGCRSIIDRRERQRNDERMQRARRSADNAEKILNLVGEEALRRGLPQGLVESDAAAHGRSPDARRVAELAMNAHGDDILRHHTKDLTARFPEMPAAFQGSSASRRLVAELGLPESYAGVKVSAPPAEEVVDGPTVYPKLHPYQEKLTANMVRLLTRVQPGRAMLCLPTGAGKTRVAVEAVIDVVRQEGLRGPVLWIAQSEELCEQAVQSWKFVWSAVGPKQRLTISRLWSGNAATEVRGNPHLVVATDAKLERCLDTDEYAWLREPAMVIVDEAHTSISARYTALLRSLGLTHATTRRPLVGLTATPFRSTNEEETRRLVDRYGALRLDDGVFEGDAYAALQELGMLARVDHRELSGATITLTEEELLVSGSFQGLATSAEERLALDDDRNKRLLEEILTMPAEWPVLVFAASVNHAKLLAAMLNGKGVSAASIDASMPAGRRRDVVHRFREGGIRILTNYGVLAQGFDAPATRAVVVARPTYSPNSYQQMIGRGLRGPNNGGSARCLVLNVRDNILNFGEELVFSRFEHLWSR